MSTQQTITVKSLVIGDVSKRSLGLDSVDNTSDLDKPISTAQQTAIDLKADQATTYTKIASDSLLDLKSDQATTYTKVEVDGAISSLIADAPGALDTLNELAAALGDDANFATTVTAAIALKAPLASPAFTGNGTIDGHAILDFNNIGLDVQPWSTILDNTTASFTTAIASDITTNNAKVGITTAQASDITTNNAKVGITTAQASDITANNAKVGITTAQAADITTNNAKVGITTAQANEITSNTLKVGITPTQSSDITTNNAKVGITPAQASEITANNAKVGITPTQASDITTNNAKVGITSAQASDITANNAKSVRTDTNGAISIGDLGGNARGTDAINIQASRDNAAEVASVLHSIAIGNESTASGYYGYSLAVGYNTTASGYYGYDTAIGVNATASGSYSTAIGLNAEATGFASTAIGNDAEASSSFSIAIGRTAIASGSNVAAIGSRVKTTVSNTTEIGYWSGGSTRAGAIRVHGTGMVAQTIQNRATAYTDGGATKGSEADNTVIREGIAIRRNGLEILIDLNSKVLNYDAETGTFTVGLVLTGGTSGATATITALVDNGTTGELHLGAVTGTFETNETITDSSTGSATSNGVITTAIKTLSLGTAS
jgi:hypothetical protein